MGLTGLDIFKQLPKTNCKDCGQATCLAFAMQIAAGKAGLDGCPHVSSAAKEALEAASAPPVALVKIGTGEKEIQLGNETVLFRHDKRFEHPTAITISVNDTEDVAAKVQAVNKLVFDRVGMLFSVNMVAVINASGDAAKFADAVKTAQENTEFPLALCTEDAAAMGAALEVAGSKKPLIYAATAANYEAMAELAKKYECPLAVKGADINELADLSEKVSALGCKQLILDSGAREVNKMLADQTQIRRLAINKRFRPFGYPTIAIVTSEDPVQAVLDASVYISKYAGVVVLSTADPAEILPLITLRLNIYTDPQKPIAVESKLYAVGEPGPDAPVFVTTNFSLTYFCVQGDVEAARIPAYILPVDSDGTSVLTAWAAGKLTPDSITELIKKSGIEDKVNHKKLILPGGVAVLSGKLAEISGWEVLVGPYDSGGIPSFLKQRWV
ncbi:CO dehydrogenase/acetyl-CoA synthase delta subunit, TIM barrel [Desulfofarcimen acetoxidans DSM 771]|jgi:acetyl-CoA decarbonylase/synthase complex subunit gamma|uniref:CO dehydrogenase/acetyl-CoA synthase delta subunit, TIM barrel n=1 Tax=Desulfofarcimen acetoxidans (strain ATCC 49208 / DSM 771 / KCTC 5769 / VKM B-1644 / 5575) TaxID=485916 RepID=C8W5H2_DESAS|nr:acetyl-CoA decarbonylase/synthase complex subunit gamma [Desulfofarcimen acetoxidans]ACV62154.1 CO dehydrogenase/acetyl-CoA synthase delta subunit, TIM barrel [Desulfofarcimen acetoxidans DSM 771]